MRFLVTVQESTEQANVLLAELRARVQVREWGLHADGQGGMAIVHATSETELRRQLERVATARANSLAVTALAEPPGAMARLRAQSPEAWETLSGSW